METIGHFQRDLENQPDQVEARAQFHSFLENLQKNTAYDVREIVIDDLGSNVAGDFHRNTKIVRADKKLIQNSITANDMNFLEHVIHHEFTHKEFEAKSGAVAIIDNRINEAVTEVIAGEKSKQGPQTYGSERQVLTKLENKSGENITQLFKEGKATKINEIIAANDEDYAIVA